MADLSINRESDGEGTFSEVPSKKNLKYSLFIAAIVGFAVLLVAGTVALMILSRLDEQSFHRQEFEFSASIFLIGLENVFHRWERTLLQLRAVVELSYASPIHSDNSTNVLKEPLTLRQWQLYLRETVDKDPDTTTYFMGWVAKVTLEHRAEWEEYIGDLYHTDDFDIIELSEKGEVVHAGVRPVYFPFGLMWPWREGREIAMDLASEERRKAILELAFQEDSPTISEPITFVGDHRGVYLLLPAFDLSKFPALDKRDVKFACSENDFELLSCDALLGFVTLLIQVDSAVEEAAELSLQNTHVKVTDLSADEILTEYNACKHPSSDDLKLRRIITLDNRHWQIDMHLCGAQEHAYSNYKWLILAGAVILSAVIMVAMFFLKANAEKAIAAQRAYRSAEAQREAEERSRLLAEEEQLEAAAARERAEEISTAKSRFLSNMNRELRTPLSGVVGTIDILQNALPRGILADFSEDFDTISNCAEVLLSTVNDILDINKLMTGKLMLHYSYFYIRDTIQSCISTVRVAASRKRVVITMRMPKSLRVVLSDQARLSQIVLNYLSNAVKFTPEDGRITITLEWKEVDEHPLQRLKNNSGDVGMGKDDLRRLQETCRTQRTDMLVHHKVESYREQMILCVEDSGIGIAEDKIGNLFQPFEQADASVTRAYGGTGLGLSICRQLAELLGGSVWVESTIGIGSKFYLSLPMDIVVDENGEKLALLNEELGCSRKKQLKMIASLSEKNLKQRRGDMFDMFDVKETHVLHQKNSDDTQSGEGSSRQQEGFAKDTTRNDFQEGMALRQNECCDHISPTSSSSSSSSSSSFPSSSASPSSLALNLVSDKNDSSQQPRKRKAKKKLTRQFSGKDILIVEDNLLNQRVFTKYLKSAGVKVTVANNGQLGVEAAMAKKFDLILMDCHMPVMDGYLASQLITNDERCVNKSTPIIALTADVEESNKKRCEESGMVDFLTKPLQSNTLYEAIGKYLS